LDVTRGHTLAEANAFEPTRRLDVRLDLLQGVGALKQGRRVRFHAGAAEILGRLTPAGTYARVHLESPAVVTRGDRFIIRSYSPLATIGGGVVLDPRPPRVAIRSAAGVERLRRLDSDGPSPDAAINVFVTEANAAGLPRTALVSRAGLSSQEADRAIERLTTAGTVTPVGDVLVAPRVRIELANRLVSALQAHHKAQPLSDGMPREEARERLFRRSPDSVFEAVLKDLVDAGRIVARERLALAGHQLSLSPEESRVHAALERVYLEARFAPPDARAAASAAGATPAVVERMLALMVRTRRLVKVDALLFHAATLEDLKADVRTLKATGTKVDVATFKERYGVTRKYAIPLLEYLDRERVTRRVGDARVVL
jgi:selenocysteine-specific elongation factor